MTKKSERTFAVCVLGDATEVTGVVPKSELRALLRSALYPPGPLLPTGEKDEEARWRHVSRAANWQLSAQTGDPLYYEYYDGECTIRAFVVGGAP